VQNLSRPIQARRSTHTVFMISRSNVSMSTNVSSWMHFISSTATWRSKPARSRSVR
jgi:P_ylase: glycogen/starch/alpha-glucan phosphorylases